jgi:hypothetical protein
MKVKIPQTDKIKVQYIHFEVFHFLIQHLSYFSCNNYAKKFVKYLKPI